MFGTHVIVLVSLLNRMFAFMLHSECTTSCFMAKSVVWYDFQSLSNKQARQTFHWFVLNSHFIKPSECKYVPFACLSARMQVSFIPLRFRYFGRKFELCHPLYDFSGKQWGSTIKVSIELPVATKHRRDMTEKMLKATLNTNTHTHTFNLAFLFAGIKYLTQ